MAQTHSELVALNDSQFPTVHKGRNIHICLNPTGEIFIKNLKSGVTMRMNGDGGSINFTTFNCGAVLEPVVVANNIGWRVAKK